MKKLKVLLAAVMCLGGISSYAQKNVTSTYITNATLSNGTNGWTASNFKAPVKGDNTIGYASEAYCGWSAIEVTNYSLTQKITLPAGNYRLVNYSFYREGEAYNTDANTSRAYLKAGEKQTPLKTLGSITAPSYANSQAEGANCFDSKMYRNVVEFNIAADNTEIEIGLVGTFEVMRSWCIAGMFELYDLDEKANIESPTDVTYAITNPGFEYRDISGWTNNNGSWIVTDNNNFSSNAGLGYIEKWVSSSSNHGSAGDFSQTIKGLDAGLYEISLYAQNIEQGNSDKGGTGMYLFANDNKTEVSSIGQYKVRATIKDGEDLTIGIRLQDCSGNWIAFDRFEMLFYGDPLEAYQTLLDQKVKEATEIAEDINAWGATAVYNSLISIINDNDNSPKTFEQESEFSNAIETIDNALKTIEPIKSACIAYSVIKSGADEMVKVSNDNADATEALETAIENAATEMATADTKETINGISEALKNAIVTFITAATPTTGNKFDLTCLLTNPNLEGLPTWKAADGWYTEQKDGNSQVMVNDSKTNGSYTAFYEYWSQTAKTSGYTVYLKINLPKGVYGMTAQAFAEDQDGQDVFDGITFSANDVDGSKITTTKLSEASISFYQQAASEVKLGLKAHAGNTRNWMGIGYVKLYKVANDQASGVYETVVASANTTLNAEEYKNITGKERATLAALASESSPADYVAAIEELQNAIAIFINAKSSYDRLAAANRAATAIGTDAYQTTNETVAETALAEADNLFGTMLGSVIDSNTGKTLGFGIGEYAPYTNIELIQALAKANGITDVAATASSVLEETITTLGTKEWKENEAEMNAVYNGNFALSTNDGELKGWIRDTNTQLPGGEYQPRPFVLTEGDGNYAKLASFGQGDGTRSCAFLRWDDRTSQTCIYSYGLTDGYTMPLKTNSIYHFQAQVGGWGSAGNSIKIALLSTDGTEIMAQTMAMAEDVDKNGKTMLYDYYYIVPSNGNYKLVLSNASNVKHNIVISNIKMTTVEALPFADGSVPYYAAGTYPSVKITRNLTADRWATAVYPFAVSGIDDIATFEAYDEATATVKIRKATASTANEPFLMRSKTTMAEIVLENVDVVAEAGTPVKTQGNASFVGTYNETDVAKEDGFSKYALSNNTFYIIGANAATVAPYRAYFKVANETSEARSLNFEFDDNTPTGIESVNAETTSNGDIYNLNGQKVATPMKGLYIMNGKKIVIK